MGKKKKKNNKRKIEDTKKIKINKATTKQLEEAEEKSKKKNKKEKKKKKRSKIKLFIKIFFALILLAVIVGAGIIAGILFSDDWTITKEDLTLNQISTTIYDKDGNEIATVSGDEKRRLVRLDDVPENLKDAFISIEDETFEKHHGINLKRTIGATVTYILHRGGSSYGGSTITQQLIKNLKNDKENSGLEGIKRKIREISRAYQVERLLSKDQILELYLNLIFMGGDVYGIELGSQYYFAKSCTELDLAECAFLAGINNAPNMYNPYGETDNTELIKRRTKIVLGKMKELGKITPEECDEAVAKVDAGFEFKKGTPASGNTMSYLARAALNQVIKQYAEEKELTWQYAKTKVESGGFKIYTTQDTAIQSIMEDVYRNNDDYLAAGRKKDDNGNLINEHVQSAMVIMDHKTGKVVGCMGGYGNDVDSNGLNRATSARQPGSAIKPIASIAPALEAGIITGATVYNEKSTYFGNYHPTSSDRGLITVRKAIEISANTTEVKIMTELGPRNSIVFLRKMGVTSLVLASENPDLNDESLPMVLGGLTYGISPLEMAGAYGTIANDGVYITPTFYTKVENNKGETILEPVQEKNRVMSEGNSFVLKDILTGPVGAEGGGTAPYCKIPGQATGGKTGTTNDDKDRWFCGFTPYYTATAWYGYDSPEPTHSSTNPAARLWAIIMKRIHEDLPNSSFERPSNITSARICKASGKVATDECKDTYSEYFVRGTVPDKCEGHKVITICKETGKIANENCTDTEEVYYTELPDKEKSGHWRTPNNDELCDIPEEVCDVHKKVMVKVPKVIGLKKEDAEKKLKNLKLNVTVTIKESDKENGIVISQSKAEGTEVAEGENITIVVSKKKGGSSSSGNTVDTGNTVNTGNTTNTENTEVENPPDPPANNETGGEPIDNPPPTNEEASGGN